MKTLSGFIYAKIMGWKLQGEFPDIPKSVTIFAPHTSNWDSFIGKLYLNEVGVDYNVLAKKELFSFPLGILMRAVKAIPIDRKNKAIGYIEQAAELITTSERMHLFIAPEGTRAKADRWKKGFYHIAKKANVPIILIYLDYRKKEIGVKGVISDLDNLSSVMQQINAYYGDVTAKHPENFALDYHEIPPSENKA